ncbi:MAG: hypothetical protein OXD50_16295 [Chloroflexi bacterium]|nr:hypothetical protein [Chloroflexota bacterium]
MNQRSGRAVERFVELVGMGMLLLVLILVMWLFGMSGAFLLDDVLHHAPGLQATRPGIELVVVPLIAIAAARWRWGADRILTLRWSGAVYFLPALMCASLVGLITYLLWSWMTPLTTVGPNEFGLVRWLGTALAALFVVLWLPLFPRITATLAGMIAGPALLALVGYSFSGSFMQIDSPSSDGPRSAAIGTSFLATLVYLVAAIYLNFQAWRNQMFRPERQSLKYAVWSGTVMFVLAFLGATGEH